ncbi:MAG: LexA family transcriptional regulator [Parcubacteria group bacterium]|jgi:repressor LexA
MKNYQQKLLSFYKKYRRMPSYREIMGLCKFKSINSVTRLVKKMIEAELISKDEKGRLLPKKLFGETKILGSITAGFPSPAEEELVDTITIDEFLISNKEATYMLNVSGDSMIDAGIRSGDIVLVERGKASKDGDIVIAEVDGKWTMKFLEKLNGKTILMPANKKYKPIIPKEELIISAVVISVIRKYH